VNRGKGEGVGEIKLGNDAMMMMMMLRDSPRLIFSLRYILAFVTTRAVGAYVCARILYTMMNCPGIVRALE